MDRRRSRASVNRSQAGIRSRRRRLGVVVPPRASDHPLHESSSETQSAKTGSNPTAAHGFSAARLLRAAVFQGSQAVTMQRLRPLSTPTYPQRTAPARHTGCSHRLRPLPPFRSQCAAPPQSLSLGSFGDCSRVPSNESQPPLPVRLQDLHGACGFIVFDGSFVFGTSFGRVCRLVGECPGVMFTDSAPLLLER